MSIFDILWLILFICDYRLLQATSMYKNSDLFLKPEIFWKFGNTIKKRTPKGPLHILYSVLFTPVFQR